MLGRDSSLAGLRIGEEGTLVAAHENLSQVFSILFGRLIKSRLLRRARKELAFQFSAIIYSPGLSNNLRAALQDPVENTICNSFEMLSGWTERIQPLPPPNLHQAAFDR